MVIIIVFLCSFIYGPLSGSLGEKTAVADDGAGTAGSSIEIVSESLQDIHRQKENLTPTQRKIDMDILQAVVEIEKVGPAAAFSAQVTSQNTEPSPSLPPLVKTDSAGNIKVKLTVSGLNAEQLKELENLGVNVTITLPEYGIVEGWLPYDQAEAVAGLGFVTRVGTPGYLITNTGAVNSEGDAVLRANLARATFGVDGSGIKIGVMSDDVTYLAASVASGDLPSSPPVHVLKAGSTSHNEGTAMLEIIHDLAPGATLSFYGPDADDSSDMILGIRALKADGCRIIVDDLSWSDEPKFEDGPIAQEARAFVNGGGVYVTACGNDAQTHYYHGYVRASLGNTYYPYAHDYGNGDVGNTLTLANGQQITVILQWNDQWGHAGDDFDIYLYRSSGGSPVAGSYNSQNGSGDPWEGFQYTNNTGTTDTFFIAVLEHSLTSAPSLLVLDYHVWYSSGLHYTTAQNSVIGHEAIQEVISTAAVAAATPGTIEPYSSQGPATIYFPTLQTRQVPNITGTDGVNTYTGQAGHFSNPFYGTSAAAPHVAAIAALVWQANPTLTPANIQNILDSTSVDLGAPGVDYIYGWGRVDAYKAVDAATIPTVTLSSTAPNPTKTSPIPVTATFSETVTGFVVGDITVGNGSAGSFVAVSGKVYTFNVTPAGQGQVTVDIAAGVAQDTAGNGNTAATQLSRTYDSVAPTVTLTSTAPNPTNTSPIPVTATFSEAVTGFVVGDITVGNGNAGNFVAVSGTVYTFSVTPTGQGQVTVDIAAGVAQDAAGNGNAAATQLTRTYDTVAPTVTINQAAGQADPTNTSPINFTVIFSEPVTDFITGDVTLSGTAGATTATITGSGTTYAVAVSGMTSDGTVIATIAAGKAHDAAGNSNAASTSTDNTVTYDTTAPIMTSAQTKTTTTIAVTFSEDVNGTTVSKANFAVAGNTVIAAGRTANGVVTLTLGTVIATDATPNVTYTKGTLADLAGNLVATTTVAASDGIAPTLTSVNIASSNAKPTLAKAGDTVTLTIIASESLQTLTATIASHAATVSGSGINWSATYVMTSEDTEWLVEFSIAFSDLPGNVGTPVTYTTDGSFVSTLEDVAPIRGFTYEVNHNVLSGVTITLKKDGLEIATTLSDSQGNYTIIAPQTGTYSVIASKVGFRDDTQSVNITTLGQEYMLNFKGKQGLIPNAPDIWYLLDCAALWKYPPADPELGLNIWRLLDVAAAWKYPK